MHQVQSVRFSFCSSRRKLDRNPPHTHTHTYLPADAGTFSPIKNVKLSKEEFWFSATHSRFQRKHIAVALVWKFIWCSMVARNLIACFRLSFHLINWMKVSAPKCQLLWCIEPQIFDYFLYNIFNSPSFYTICIGVQIQNAAFFLLFRHKTQSFLTQTHSPERDKSVGT